MVMELSARSLAIARGEDPDAVAAPSEPADREAGEYDPADERGQEVSRPELGDDDFYPEDDTQEANDHASAQPGQDALQGGGKEAASAEWLNDDVRALGATYGFTDAELAAFGSAENFTRASVVLERKLAAQAASEAAQPETPAVKPTEAAKTATPPAEPELSAAEQMLAKHRDEFSDEALEVLQALAEQSKAERAQTVAMEQRLNQVLEHFSQQENQRTVDEFHQLVDALGDDGFGKWVDGDKIGALSADQDARRRKLFDAAVKISQVAGDVPLKTLIHKARLLEFGDELLAGSKGPSKAEQARQQAAKRRPGNSGRPRTPAPARREAGQPMSKDDEVAAILAAPKIRKFISEAREDNGY